MKKGILDGLYDQDPADAVTAEINEIIDKPSSAFLANEAEEEASISDAAQEQWEQEQQEQEEYESSSDSEGSPLINRRQEKHTDPKGKRKAQEQEVGKGREEGPSKKKRPPISPDVDAGHPQSTQLGKLIAVHNALYLIFLLFLVLVFRCLCVTNLIR